MRYKEWSPLSLSEAMKAVTRKNISIRKAAELYGVPRSTLGDHIRGRVLPGAKSGPSKLLSDEEELELLSFLCRLSEIGYPKTRRQVIELVQRIVSSRGHIDRISNGWWDSFQRRHPELSLRSASSLSTARSKASNPQCIDQYFNILEETLEEYALSDKPGCVFNMDETGMPLDPKAPKTIHMRGKRNPCCTSSGAKVQITVVGCVSASGQSLPPMVIWDRKTLNPQLAEGEVPGTIYGLSAKGWMDGVLFDQWFCRHFLTYAPPARPLLLLLDGHSSHFCPHAVELAAKEKVVLFTLPPNTTHLTQPLDKGIFGPLKFAWRRVCHEFLSRNPGRGITRYDFSSLFSEAWIEAMTPKNIMAGFRTTGVYPVNRHACQLPGAERKVSLSEKTGLSYIPLYTPAKSLPPAKSSFTPSTHTSRKRPVFSDRYQPSLRQKPLMKFLALPSPVHQVSLPQFESTRNSRVLTSEENLKILKEKEQAKLEKIKQKEERAKRRQEKKADKVAEKLRKQRTAQGKVAHKTFLVISLISADVAFLLLVVWFCESSEAYGTHMACMCSEGYQLWQLTLSMKREKLHMACAHRYMHAKHQHSSVVDAHNIM